MSEDEKNPQTINDFGEFELDWQPQKFNNSDPVNQKKPSLAELQRVYSKNKSKKRKSELDQIKNFNDLQPERKSQQVKTAPTIQSHSLLNQEQISVKTVPQIYIELSCTAHIFAILINAYLVEHVGFIDILVYMCQILTIAVNIVHLYINLSFKCVKKRCNFIRLHIVTIFVAFMALCSLIAASPRQFYLLIILAIDGLLVNKLVALYRTQKNMDADIHHNSVNNFQQMMESSQL